MDAFNLETAVNAKAQRGKDAKDKEMEKTTGLNLLPQWVKLPGRRKPCVLAPLRLCVFQV
jgi:hypothetical protein